MRRKRSAQRLAKPQATTDLESELVERVKEALVDQSTPAPLPPRLRERMDELLHESKRGRR